MPKRPDVYWLEQTDADVPLDCNWLNAAEQTQLGSMRFPKRQADWRLGRWTAKRAIATHLELPSDRPALRLIELRPRSSGAPVAYVDNRPAPLSISLSHRAGVAMCALSAPETPLGCDLEIDEARAPCFVEDYFTISEQQLIRRMPSGDQEWVVALLWSSKESALKALQTGLRLSTQGIEVSLPNDSPNVIRYTWNPLDIHYATGSFHGWWQREGRFVRTIVAANIGNPPRALLARSHQHSYSSKAAS